MKLKYSFEKIDLDGKDVYVPVGEGADKFHGIIRVNEVGSLIMGLLEKDVDETQIVSELEQLYDVNHDIAVSDTKCVLREFEEKGLLEK